MIYLFFSPISPLPLSPILFRFCIGDIRIREGRGCCGRGDAQGNGGGRDDYSLVIFLLPDLIFLLPDLINDGGWRRVFA